MHNFSSEQNAFRDVSTIEERIRNGLSNNSTYEGGIIPFLEDWDEKDLTVSLKNGKVKKDIFELINKGWTITLYRYRSASGMIVQIVLRLDDPAQTEKFIRPLRVERVLAGICQVVALAIEAPRPLYGLERLASASAQSEVLLVEGEKAADAGQVHFPEIPVLTWSSGAQGFNKSDLSPLSGRQVIIWPDNDPTGAASTKALATLLLGTGARSVRIVEVPDYFPDKWDLADLLPVPHG